MCSEGRPLYLCVLRQKKAHLEPSLIVPRRGQVRLQARRNLAYEGNLCYGCVGQEVTPLAQES